MDDSRSTRGDRVLIRLFIFVLAVLLHLALGIAGLAAYEWKTGNLIFADEPHTLDGLLPFAFIFWFVAPVAILKVALQDRSRWRLRLQLLVPVIWATAWLALVVAVDEYPVTIRAEVRDSAVHAAPGTVGDGMQVLEIMNATSDVCNVGLINDDREWQYPNGGPTIYVLSVSLPVLRVDPGETDRWVQDLAPGRYTIVCAADPSRRIPADQVAPAAFEVND